MKNKALLFILFLFTIFSKGFSQNDTNKAAISVNCDFVNQYIWRGQLLNKSMNIQPSITFTKNGFSLGTWATYAINGEYAEADLFIAYEYKWLKLTVYDYFTMNNNINNNNYFEYDDKKTAHIIEPTLEFNGGEKLPLRLAASVFAYGLDKDTAGKNYYSSYFELGYNFKINDNNINIFTGFTPKAGFYGPYEGIVNAGMGVKREINITDRYSLPIKCELISNPQKENIFVLFTISL